MKKMIVGLAAVLSLVTVAWVQVTSPAPRALASLVPAGPLVYLEAKDFAGLLNDWNRSGVKRDWLASTTSSVYANSNLGQKLAGLYQEYGLVAGFLPGLAGTLEIAGTESALALYDPREQHYVYLTRIPESQLLKSQLWRLKTKFTERQASGISFYLRRDDASHRTVAFAWTQGWLILATRDDLMASTLALISQTAGTVSVAEEPWAQTAFAQAGKPGEIRMALNMQRLVNNIYFRSYWIQRNVSEQKQFDSGVVDVVRTNNQIEEHRVFLRTAERQMSPPSANAISSLSSLRALAPDDAVLVKGWASPSSSMAEALIAQKLLEPKLESGSRFRYAPQAAATDGITGSEQDLEVRIDQPALRFDGIERVNLGALHNLIAGSPLGSILQIQSATAAGRFVRTPSVIVLAADTAWEPAPVRAALQQSITALSSGPFGLEWQSVIIGTHRAEQLNGLATLIFAIDGKFLFLANDSALLGATLNRIGTPSLPGNFAYTAEFRHTRARPDYLRIMKSLDFGASLQAERTPRFFSENLADLSAMFSFVKSASFSTEDTAGLRRQVAIYR